MLKKLVREVAKGSDPFLQPGASNKKASSGQHCRPQTFYAFACWALARKLGVRFADCELVRELEALPGDRRFGRAARAILAEIEAADAGALAEEFRRNGGRTDPVVHFYEILLEACDPAARKALGAYFTPEPVVGYLKRSADILLRDRLGFASGLADPRALVLDPACGTGAFLAGGLPCGSMIGFDISPAACDVARLALSAAEGRGRALPTESLDDTLRQARALLAERGPAAIPVVIGNPPYSRGSGTRPGEVESLLASYKAAVRGATNLQPLSDDYIRFIRFAQALAEESGQGITALITSNSFLDGRVHRGMREELMRAYSEIYALDLNGSAKVDSRSDGPDENVFDIQQGVCITLMVRRPGAGGARSIFHASLTGTREEKLSALSRLDVASTPWRSFEPEAPLRVFAPRSPGLARIDEEYLPGIPLDELFRASFTGVGTGRDATFVAFEPEPLRALGRDLLNPRLSSTAFLKRHGLRDTPSWNLSRRRSGVQGNREPSVIPYSYRPFDVRHVLYEPVIRRDQRRNMTLLEGGNVALLTCQRLSAREFHHAYCVSGVTDESILSNRTRERAILFPLRAEDGENVNPAALERLAQACGNRVTAEEAFYLAHAVLHSPSYRARYAEQLRGSFARIPAMTDPALVRELAELGRRIAELQLGGLPIAGAKPEGPRLAGSGTGRVERVRCDAAEGTIWISRTQRFEGVSAAAISARVGAYAVCEKWLKERRGRRLSQSDVEAFRAMALALDEIARLAARIDAAVDARGGWAEVARATAAPRERKAA